MKRNIKLNRKDYTSIIRFKTGHGKYQVNLYKVNLINNLICLCEKELRTLNRIIFGCIKNKTATEMLLQYLIKNGIHLFTNTVTLLKTNKESVEKGINFKL